MPKQRFWLPIVMFALLSTWLHAQHPEIRVWNGKAPGSEKWTGSNTFSPDGKFVTAVVDPTLTVYLPDPAIATGTAVVICPGGGFRLLSWQEDGIKTAEWLNSKGIAAFILKYRVLPGGQAPPAPGQPGQARPMAISKEIEIKNGNANPSPENQELNAVVHMGISDGQEALRLVRRRAAEWKIDPKRVGILGYSAGGGVAVGAALGEQSDGYPDFAISLYGPSLVDVNVPAYGAPLFIAVGTGHPNVAKGCVALYSLWKEAKRPVELHAYDMVNGGFGFTPRGLPVDTWPDRLYDWMKARGIAGSPRKAQ